MKRKSVSKSILGSGLLVAAIALTPAYASEAEELCEDLSGPYVCISNCGCGNPNPTKSTTVQQNGQNMVFTNECSQTFSGTRLQRYSGSVADQEVNNFVVSRSCRKITFGNGTRWVRDE
jgi:hypothetical protein